MNMFENGLHVAIIMDGNGRWGTQHNKKRIEGHKVGAETLYSIIKNIPSDISILTVYAFSLENWSRSLLEVYHLINMAKEFLNKHLETFIQEGIKVNFIGDRTILPTYLVSKIQETEEKTKHGTKLLFNIAFSYGSRQEIMQAIQIAQEKGTDFTQHLSTANIQDPDILIRTGGEKRLSNYLLWQLAYTELFFIDTLWPDFTEKDLITILQEYNKRTRKYGFA